ncbi:MAG: hypothetical protein IKI30_03165 [Oxalobacter sp.]|nr:hypothetical protein [Oxalobacter sp.]
MKTTSPSANAQDLGRLQEKLRRTLVELALNWQMLSHADVVQQLLEEWQADYREGEAERYASDRVKAVQWLDTQLEKRMKAEKAVVPDWQTAPVQEGLSAESLDAMPVVVDAVLHLLQSIDLPDDSEVLQRRLAHYAQQATKRLNKVTQELNANLEKTDLELQQHLQAWHGACQKLLMETEGSRDSAESVRIHALLAMSAETYLYWQRMVAEGWQVIPEQEGGMPPYHVTAKMLADQAKQASLLAGQCLQDIMLNWFRLGTANQDTLMDWLAGWSSSFAGFGGSMEHPAAVEQLELLADELDSRSSKMRRETEGWKNFGPGQRLPAIGIPYEIRELLETVAAARGQAVKNASESMEIQRLYESCSLILPGLHEVAKNLQAMADDNDADELENWVHLQMNAFIQLSKVSRSHAARAAGLFADVLDERIDLERDVRTNWLRLTKQEWDAAQPSSPEKAGVMMGQAVLRIGKIRHHRPDKM